MHAIDQKPFMQSTVKNRSYRKRLNFNRYDSHHRRFVLFGLIVHHHPRIVQQSPVWFISVYFWLNRCWLVELRLKVPKGNCCQLHRKTILCFGKISEDNENNDKSNFLFSINNITTRINDFILNRGQTRLEKNAYSFTATEHKKFRLLKTT